MTFLPSTVIARKRDGNALTSDEIHAFIAGFAKGTVSETQAAAFAMAVFIQNMNIDERVALTEAMRDSGSILQWSDLQGPIVDKHSTGGVGDNVSLMLAPILAACGVYVPMISGRGLGHSGGTLDKLDAIPGYGTNTTSDLLKQTVREVGCAIVGQTDDLAPADRALYAIRDVTATVANISLITSSILSKKLAEGLNALILDVKVGSGAFMKTPEEAHELSHSMVDVANGAGVRTGALITDMNQPLASAAGNALETRNAVDFLTGRFQDPRLLEVVLELAATTLLMAERYPNLEKARQAVEHVLNSGQAAERFAKMNTMLGGPADFVEKMDSYLEVAPIIRDVFADTSGVVSSIETREIGMSVIVLGGGRRQASDALDYRVGFDQLAPIGRKIEARCPIARIHARDEKSALEAEQKLKKAYIIGDRAIETPLIAKRILPKEAS